MRKLKTSVIMAAYVTFVLCFLPSVFIAGFLVIIRYYDITLVHLAIAIAFYICVFVSIIFFGAPPMMVTDLEDKIQKLKTSIIMAAYITFTVLLLPSVLTIGFLVIIGYSELNFFRLGMMIAFHVSVFVGIIFCCFFEKEK